jgi:hypothetical protein
MADIPLDSLPDVPIPRPRPAAHPIPRPERFDPPRPGPAGSLPSLPAVPPKPPRPDFAAPGGVVPVWIVGPLPLPVSGSGGGGGKGGKKGEGDDEEKSLYERLKLAAKVFVPGAVIGTAGDALSGIAKNELSPTIQGLDRGVKAAAAGLAQLGTVGAVAGAGLNALSEAAQAARNVMRAFVERGRELAAYSGPLAAASARADVARLLADVREAQSPLGDQMARLIENEARVEIAVREGLAPLKLIMLQALNAVLDYTTKAAPTLAAWSSIIPGVSLILPWLAGRIVAGAGGPKPGEDLLTPILDEIAALPVGPVVPHRPPAPAAMAPPVILDILGGGI